MYKKKGLGFKINGFLRKVVTNGVKTCPNLEFLRLVARLHWRSAFKFATKDPYSAAISQPILTNSASIEIFFQSPVCVFFRILILGHRGHVQVIARSSLKMYSIIF